MGCAAVEIILFVNETMKVNDNLNLFDEKVQKGPWVKFKVLWEKKILTLKKSF